MRDEGRDSEGTYKRIFFEGAFLENEVSGSSLDPRAGLSTQVAIGELISLRYLIRTRNRPNTHGSHVNRTVTHRRVVVVLHLFLLPCPQDLRLGPLSEPDRSILDK